MTSEQDLEFSQFGCVCRSLLFLANQRKTRVLTRTEFIDEFSAYYPRWRHGQCGLSNAGMIPEIARKLNLATEMEVYRLPSRVRDHIDRKETRTVLLITEKRPPVPPNVVWEVFMHCRIVVAKTHSEWSVVEIDDQITNGSPLAISDADLDAWTAYFCVLF